MKKRITQLLCFALTAAVFFPLAVRANEPSPADTTQVVRFHFQFDKSAFLRDYRDNAAGLDAVAAIADDTEAVGKLRGVTVTGAASPMMDAARNESLSHERAREVGGFLGWKHPALKTVGIELRSVGEDWTGLETLVENSTDLPMRSEVLRILRSGASSEEKSAHLLALNGGRVYEYMRRNILPELRYAEVEMTFAEVQRQEPKQQPETQPQTEPSATLTETEPSATGTQTQTQTQTEPLTASAAPSTATPADKRGYRFAVKTNLMEWAGVFPDFSGLRGGVNYYGVTPNLEAEWFIDRRWSLAAAGSWAGFRIGSDDLTRRWGYSTISLEPRVWFDARRSNTGFFAGVYGSVGQYNLLFKGMRYAESGDLYSVGVSVGYAAMLTKHLMIEAGMRGGYAHADNFSFPADPYNARHKVSTGSVTGFRLQSLKVSVGYRFGKGK